MDGYLVEQHSYRLGQGSRPEDEVPDDTSWVMLDQNGNVKRLAGERFVLKGNGRVSFEITPTDSRRREEPLPPKSSNGDLYLTTLRVIYIPERKTEAFESFAAPILNVGDAHVNTHLFGSWYWKASVTPVADGGIPLCYPFVDVKATFHDGGCERWQQRFEYVKENLTNARAMGASLETHAHLEQLPRYEARSESSSGPIANPPAVASPQPAPPLISPGEAPPGYEEAQAQAVRDRLGQALRDETAREASE